MSRNGNLKYKSEVPEYGYHVLRGALEKYGKGLADLNTRELEIVARRADKTFTLESRVLASEEANGVVIQPELIASSVQGLIERYPDYAAFLGDLNANGLTEDALYVALHRELLFDAVMKKVASRSPSVSDIDVQLFYQMHKDRFTVPEVRHARHLLITVNKQYAESRREMAKRRIGRLHKQLRAAPASFPDLVMRNSECPTALQGGVLGKVTRGVLYPELDAVLFGMRENEISDVVETELGFHILLCDRIEPQKTIPLTEARHRIRILLDERQQRNCQKAWLAELGRQSR